MCITMPKCDNKISDADKLKMANLNAQNDAEEICEGEAAENALF